MTDEAMAEGASTESPGADPAPQKPDPTPLDATAFKMGFGKGAEKGRKEGMSMVLENLGLPMDLEEAKSHISSLSAQRSEPDPKLAEVAKTAKRFETELNQIRGQFETLKRQADEARREKIRVNAHRVGIGPDQADALVAMYGDSFAMNESGELEVVTAVEGTKVTGVVKVADFLQEITTKHPWMVASKATAGSGYSTSAKDPKPLPRAAVNYDERPLWERLKG